MLRLARDKTIEMFYDPGRVGKEFRARCDAVEKDLAKAHSLSEARLMIAQFFLDLGDSHTLFVPPGGLNQVDHHWRFHAVGDTMYVREVDQGSDAEKKGLRTGDKLLAIDGLNPTRAGRGLLEYLLYGLAPRSGMSLVVQSPGQEPRRLQIDGEIVDRQMKRSVASMDYFNFGQFDQETNADFLSRLEELPGGIIVWKLKMFHPKLIGPGLRKAESAKTLVLDLRGNSAGKFRLADDLLDAVFSEDFEAYATQERGKNKVVGVKGKGRFKGLLLVLIDNDSASAAEVFSRVVQKRQRGVLLGDRTAGRLQSAVFHSLVQTGLDNAFTLFGITISETGAVMADGTLIEGNGVAPDYLLLPTHEQLYLGHDPVLAKALTIAGHKTTPEEAGKLFPPLN